MENHITVNTAQCQRIGKILAGVNVRPEYYRREFISFESDRETKLRIYLLSTAICHQTHQLHHKSLNLWGWDYIEHVFLEMFRKNHPLIHPGYLSICSDRDIESYLLSAFSEDGNKENSTLDRIEERSGMLMEICRTLRTHYNRSVSSLIDQSGGCLLNNGKGLYETLSQFIAFSDPMKKKITFFLKLASDAGLIRIKDPDNMIPIMDYHMQRVLLRTGCVEITDPDLQKKILKREPLPSDEPVREGCIEAMKIIADASGHELNKMNDFIWPLGRSCCNETMLCQIRSCMKDPCSLMKMITLESHLQCLLEKDCYGADNVEYRSLWEPVVQTHYY